MKKKYNILADCRGMYEQEVIDIILEQRGITDPEHFFSPTEDDMLPLDALKNIDKAYELVKKHLSGDIRVLWDVDTDGVASGATMTKYLRDMGAQPKAYINDGKAHGLIGQDIERFAGADLLIIVDSLDADCSQYKKISESGTDIIVLDHHYVSPEQPYGEYITLVSSQVDYDNPALSGAGVVWKFCKYIDEMELTDYADKYLDLAAVGILADVSDVSEASMENRYIVMGGLKNLNNLALKKIIGSYEFNSKAVQFSVAPLINASCRLNQNEAAMNLFLTDENKEALKFKKILESCKEEQGEVLESLLPGVYKDFDSQMNSNVLYTFIDTPYGIGGVIGNKCLEVYNKPMFILKDCGDKYSGSMRSVGYGDFMKLCNDTGLAVLHGHEQASGIDIDKENFEEFIKVVNSKLSKIKQSTTNEIEIDCEISLSDLTRSLVDKVKAINLISGAGFKPLTFKVVDINEYDVGSFKDGKHLVLKPRADVQLIEWNTKADYEELEDAACMNEPIEVYGELDSGFFIRQFMLKVIMQDYKVGVM